MSNDDINKLQHSIRVVKVLVIILILLVSAYLVHSSIDPKSNSFPAMGPQGPKGDTAQVDYSQIALLVSEQIAALPKPKDGRDGKDGQSIVGPQGPAGMVGSVGESIIGPQGETGVDGRTPEFQTNPDTGDIEWRYVGDRIWTVLIEKCSYLFNCGEL